MVSENWPTYVVLTLYVLATAAVTIAANIKNRSAKDEYYISTHFLASKNFGSIILLCTTFASVFSGYTVVGVPNESGKNGFTGIRWMSLIIIIAISMSWLYPRLRRLSILRNYDSPGKFITDRFQSKPVSILVALLVCVPQLLYIGINLFSLGQVIDDLTNGELGFYAVVIASTIIILLFEAFGGMRSVAYTDAVESIVMIIIFIILPIMLTAFYGGFVGQINNSEDLTIACDNSNSDNTAGCLNYASNIVEMIPPSDGDDPPTTSESYLRSPSSIAILNYILFSLSGISFALNPHITQRALTAKSDGDVRFVVIGIYLATFITMAPGVLTGITHISNKSEFKEEYQSFGAFQALLATFRDRGGFSTFISYIALLAGIAGIMSTADSALIGVSNTISCDIFKNCIFPDYSPKHIVYIGKMVSICTMVLCLIFSIYLWETSAEYGVVYTIQQGLLWQAVPIYVFGLYTGISTNSVLLGTSIGTIIDLILIGVVFGGNNPFPGVDKSWSTFLGVLINVLITIIAHYFLFRNKTGDNSDILTINEIRKLMDGITEPITKWYGLLVWLTLALTLITGFHWIGDIDNELINNYGETTVKTFMYNGYVRNVIAGLPDWVFASFIWYVIAIIVGIVATMQWTVDYDYKLQKHVPDESKGNISLQNVKNNNNDDDNDNDGQTATKDQELDDQQANQV